MNYYQTTGAPAILYIVFMVTFMIFLNRYIIGPLRNWLVLDAENRKRDQKRPTPPRHKNDLLLYDKDNEIFPRVSIIVPCFNEGETVYHTAKSLVNLDYPSSRFDVVIVNDCSTDDTAQWLAKAGKDFPNIKLVKNITNKGKRQSIAEQTRLSDSEYILSVDSDTEVDPRSLRALLECFTEEDIAAVGGHVYVRNPYTNWLTRMQAIKYTIGYWLLKGLENSSKSVMCLSGCLTLYRKDVLIELEGKLMCREFLGIPIKYGEDRYLTRMLVTRQYKTRLTPNAHCYTDAPARFDQYWEQQLRWRRSNISDLFFSLANFHKYDPIVGLHVFMTQAMLLIYPVVIVHILMSGMIIFPILMHMMISAATILVYEIIKHTKLDKPRFPIGLWVLPLFLMLPVQYLLLNTLALFSMDESKWASRTLSPAQKQAAAATKDQKTSDEGASV